jgi:ketosteroid isomerase-like protein
VVTVARSVVRATEEAEGTARVAETTASFARALLSGDPYAAASFFAPTGRCLTPDGTQMVGRPAIAELLEQVTSSEHRLEIHGGRILLNESVAFASQHWTRRSEEPGAAAFATTSIASLVLCRAGARWQITIAAPWLQAG